MILFQTKIDFVTSEKTYGGHILALVAATGKAIKLSLSDKKSYFNAEINLESPYPLLNVLFKNSQLYFATERKIGTFEFSNCENYGNSKAVCVAIEDFSCSWDDISNRCVKKSSARQKSEIEKSESIEIELFVEGTSERIGSNPITLSTVIEKSHCTALQWFDEKFQPITTDDVKFIAMSQVGHKRAHLVIHPPEGDFSKLDGKYYLDCSIHGKTVRRTIFNVDDFQKSKNRKSEKILDERVSKNFTDEIELAISGSTETRASGVIYSLLIIPALVIMTLCTFVIILKRHQSLKSTQVE